MKKSIVAISCMAFMFLFSSAVLATTNANNGTGGTLTVTVNNVAATNTNFTFDSSPNVGIAVSTSDTAYAITTANTLTGADNNNGQEYGTLSTASGYAQRDKTTNAGVAPAPTTSETALPGDNWAWMGGGDDGDGDDGDGG